MKVGKHFWRAVVRDNEMPDGGVARCTAYGFKRPPKAGGFMVADDTRRDYREWLGYDLNRESYLKKIPIFSVL
jgi:hypothetical protein